MTERDLWLQNRKLGLGSSDAPILMGVSTYKTPLQLFLEKTADELPQEEGSYATDMGNRMEPKIRAAFEILEGRAFSAVNVQMPEPLSYLKASLDGRSDDGKEGFEAKVLGRDDWEMTKAGIVPPQYWPQVQHQIAVANLECVHFVGWRYQKGVSSISEEDLAIIKVLPDHVYIEELMKAEVNFWMNHVLKKLPPEPTDRDYKTLRKKGITTKINKWKKLKAKIETLSADLEFLRDEILEEAKAQGETRYQVAGVRIRQEARQGNIDYKKIPEVKKLKPEELNLYRAKPSVSWKMEMIKEKTKVEKEAKA